MSSIPIEYSMLKKKFKKELTSKLGEDLFDLSVYGSAVKSDLFPGVSDVNFLIVIKNPETLSKQASEVIQEISSMVKAFRDDPTFTTLLDYKLLFEQNLPNKKGLNGFSPLRALSLSDGESLIHKTFPYSDLNISEEELRNDARSVLIDIINKITEPLTTPDFDFMEEGDTESQEHELEFLAIEGALLAAQVYFMVKEKKYITKAEVAFLAEENEKESLDYELLKIVSTKRQGADYVGALFESGEEEEPDKEETSSKIYNVQDLHQRTFDFIAKIFSML